MIDAAGSPGGKSNRGRSEDNGDRHAASTVACRDRRRKANRQCGPRACASKARSTHRFGRERRTMTTARSAHDHKPVDRRTGTCEANFAVRHAAECSDFEIKGRGRAAVRSELGFTSPPAFVRCGEVEVRIFYGALELVVRGVAGEEDQRHMRFNNTDPLYCRSIGGRFAQKGITAC